MVSSGVSGAAVRRVENAVPEKACSQFDEDAGALAAVVEERCSAPISTMP
jgi:hypothetical protein